MRHEEALPSEAVHVRDIVAGEVWETEGWQYLVVAGRVVNVVQKTTTS